MEELKEIKKNIKNYKKNSLIKYLSAIILEIALIFFLVSTSDVMAITILSITVTIIIPSIIVTTYLFVYKNKIYEYNLLYKKICKKIIVEKALKEVFDEFIYEYDKGINVNKIIKTDINMYNEKGYFANDYISAKYKDVKFEFSDVALNDRYINIFKGQWYIFEFNKPFKSDIHIYSNSKMFSLGFFKNKNDYKKIELEDIEFSKKFNIYVKDELEAFYVLTPKIIEKIKKFENEEIMIFFIENELHIAIYNINDSFENIKNYDEKNLQGDINIIKNEISIITSLIDELNLDNNLFKIN